MTESTGFFDVLRADGPSADRAEVPDLYGGFVGSWDADAVDHLPDGAERRQSAEIHFARVLEGRAIQDVWIVPARSERGAVAPGNRYGTTFRYWDGALGAWRIRWLNPVNGAESTLVGRRVGDDIVQAGTDPSGRLVRWIFTAIRPTSFHWRGEISEDGGRTWVCQLEILARRRVHS